jgi:hypothetical protein
MFPDEGTGGDTHPTIKSWVGMFPDEGTGGDTHPTITHNQILGDYNHLLD